MSNTASIKDQIEEHEPHWTGKWAFQLIVIATAVNGGVMAYAVHHDNYWLAIPLVLIASHLMHGLIIGLHEASHGLLRENRTFNEFDGILIGALGLMSFSLYRAAHQAHHAYLATERDTELWPFVNPAVPRWQRVLAAGIELTFGMFYTPFLFLRAFLKKDTAVRATKVRKRVWQEFGFMVVLWAFIITLVAVTNTWKLFLWLYFIPTFIAGNLQSVRKYIEHVGLHGSSPLTATRSIVCDSWLGKLTSLTLLHEPLHGIHHRHSGLPHPVLPQYVPVLTPVNEEHEKVFPSYSAAFLHLAKCLRDPKVGPQWVRPRQPEPVDEPERREEAVGLAS
jgi:fatty acid desaturase